MPLTSRSPTYEVSRQTTKGREIDAPATFLGRRYTRKQFSVAYRQKPSEERMYRGARYSP